LIIEGFTVPYMNRLVILAPNWLGDAVMALPAIADVRRAAPAASITVAARASIVPLFAMAPDVDETLTLGGAEAETLAAQRFDTALLLPNSTRAAIVARRAGVAERWGYRTGWRGSLLTRAIPAPRGVHQIEYYQHLVRALGFPSGPSGPRVTVPPGARDAGRTLLVESGWNGRTPLVALAPGAAYGGAKRWPPEYFAELADGLAGDGVQCVIVGTAADAPTAHDVARALKARDRGPAAFAPQALRRASPKLAPVSDERRRESAALLNLVGRTELPTLAGVFDNCRALVTNDSGAMHLAAAVGIAVTAMFGPTNEQATSPRTPNPDPRIPNPESQITILTHSVWCRPCMLRECPLDHRCMRGIEVATVLEAARSSL
jgi:heptosyltransferase II